MQYVLSTTISVPSSMLHGFQPTGTLSPIQRSTDGAANGVGKLVFVGVGEGLVDFHLLQWMLLYKEHLSYRGILMAWSQHHRLMLKL